MSKTYWVIKERSNPQLGTYYKGLGPLPSTEVKRLQGRTSSYGEVVYHPFSTEAEYLAALKASGEKIQGGKE